MNTRHKGAEHLRAAAEHYDRAAEHSRQAAALYYEKDYTRAAHQTQIAAGHLQHALHHGNAAATYHAEHYGDEAVKYGTEHYRKPASARKGRKPSR